MEESNVKTIDDLEQYVTNWYRPNNPKVKQFFNDLREHLVLYSPSLGLVVEYNDWYCGNKPVDQSIDFVPITPDDLSRYWNATDFSPTDELSHWADNLLGDFEHISYYFDVNEGDSFMAIETIALVCLAPDWTSKPYDVI